MNQSDAPAETSPTLAEATRVWVRVALLSFGGPAGQIAVMHRILVEEKQWVEDHRFSHALNFCMLLPGPEAQQLATYLGWLLNGVRGGLIAGILFVVPGVLALLVLSWAYAVGADAEPLQAALFGLKCAVVAIVVQALIRIAGKALAGTTAWVIAAAAFVAIFFYGLPFPLIILAAGLAGLAVHFLARSSQGPAAPVDAGDSHRWTGTRTAGVICLATWLGSLGLLWALLGGSSVFTQIGTFFSGMAVVTFGGAYAVLAYVAQQAVEAYGWLAPGEMLDGLGLAESTPGPLIMVVQFVAYLGAFRDPGELSPLVAGTLGGLLATWVTFLPSFVWIFLLAPWMERLRGSRSLRAALSMITAAVVGVIANLALWFALNLLFTETRSVDQAGLDFRAPVPTSLDPAALALTLLAIGAALFLRLGVVTLIAAGTALGLGLHLVGLR